MRILILKEFQPSVKLSPNVQISRDKKIFHVLVLVAMRCNNTEYESKKFCFTFQNSYFTVQERTLFKYGSYMPYSITN